MKVSKISNFFSPFSEAGGLLVMALLGSAMAVMSHVAPAFAGNYPKTFDEVISWLDHCCEKARPFVIVTFSLI